VRFGSLVVKPAYGTGLRRGWTTIAPPVSRPAVRPADCAVTGVRQGYLREWDGQEKCYVRRNEIRERNLVGYAGKLPACCLPRLSRAARARRDTRSACALCLCGGPVKTRTRRLTGDNPVHARYQAEAQTRTHQREGVDGSFASQDIVLERHLRLQLPVPDLLHGWGQSPSGRADDARGPGCREESA